VTEKLEIKCDWCDGQGRIDAGDNRPYECPVCQGSGFEPTADGEKTLALVRHNFRPMFGRR
jgi:DnaJ-class molecular chaperone